MAQQQIQELKNKLEAQATQFQNYKSECKQLEQFLEEQSNKKEQEIKKLKEQSIKKQKNYNLLKTQVTQMESEIANLKQQLKEKEGVSVSNGDAEKEIQGLKKKIQSYENQNKALKDQIHVGEERKVEIDKLKAKIQELEDTVSKREGTIKDLELQISQLKEKSSKPQKNDKKQQKTPKQQKQKEKQKEKPLHTQQKNNKNNQQIKLLHKKLSQSQHQTEKAELNLIKLTKQMKEMKEKMQYLSADRQKLSNKVKQLTFSLSQKKEEASKEEHFEEEAENENFESENINLKDSLTINALIMTKKHYVSPFLQFKGENIIKMYRSTKNGCFEKSLGALKFKVNQITYESENILNQCFKAVAQNLNNHVKTSIVFYGAKKTTKKYLMAGLVERLKENILNMIDGAEEHPSAQFIKSSVQPQKRAQFVGKDREQVIEIMDKVISLGQKSPKKHENGLKKKTQSKPKVRLFTFGLGDENYLEILTTSYTHMYSRQNTNIFDALNNICYSKLPNSLQQTDTQKIIVLTVNPIVSLYEDCRNTLSVVNCKRIINGESSATFTWQGSPITDEMLNDTARKKLQNIERDNQQNSLKVKKLEDQIVYYRNKFDDLQVRLKNLLNTHGSQNTYLKKSPVTLSYEKMLKFVHSVLARNGPSLGQSPSLYKTATDFQSQAFNVDDEFVSEGEQIL